jgi:hypothetical protein
VRTSSDAGTTECGSICTALRGTQPAGMPGPGKSPGPDAVILAAKLFSGKAKCTLNDSLMIRKLAFQRTWRRFQPTINAQLGNLHLQADIYT